MSGLLRFACLLGLAVWIGGVVCFSFIVAPAIFGVLGAARAGDVVGVIFPRYYAVGAGAAATAVACALGLARRAERPARWRVAAIVMGIGLAVMVWAGAVVAPRAGRLRATLAAVGEEPGANAEFRRLHAAAVVLNGVALVAGVLGLGLSAAALRE